MARRRPSPFGAGLLVVLVLVAAALTTAASSTDPGESAATGTDRPLASADLVSAAIEVDTGMEAADPYVLVVDDTYYAFATNVDGANVPAWRSTDLTDWTYVGDVLPELPADAISDFGLSWAPSVLERDGGYVLYVTLFSSVSESACVGAATSAAPSGPYVMDRSWTLVCDQELGGAIDASPYVDDDGTAYLLWKSDGNCCELPTALWSQQLSEDGLALVGERAELLVADRDEERGVVEAPSMYRTSSGELVLLYSSGDWTDASYAVGVATCEGPQGPCAKSGSVRTSAAGAEGPGGGEVFTAVDGTVWVVFHAWTDGSDGERRRSLRLETFESLTGLAQ